MLILKHICNQATTCGSKVCTHRKDHEKDGFCDGNCRWGDSICQSDLKGYIDSVLCDLNYSSSTNVTRGSITTHKEALDFIMAAIKEEYGC